MSENEGQSPVSNPTSEESIRNVISCPPLHGFSCRLPSSFSINHLSQDLILMGTSVPVRLCFPCTCHIQSKAYRCQCMVACCSLNPAFHNIPHLTGKLMGSILGHRFYSKDLIDWKQRPPYFYHLGFACCVLTPCIPHIQFRSLNEVSIPAPLLDFP